MIKPTLLTIPKSGPCQTLARIRHNALDLWRAAIRIHWRELRGMIGEPWMGQLDVTAFLLSSDSRPFYDLITKTDTGISLEERLVLNSTIRGCILRTEYLRHFADCCDVVMKRYEFPALHDHAAMLRDTYELFFDNRDVLGIAWKQPCLSAVLTDRPWWQAWEIQENGQNRPYDITKDAGHWFLYTQFGGLNEKCDKSDQHHRNGPCPDTVSNAGALS